MPKYSSNTLILFPYPLNLSKIINLNKDRKTNANLKQLTSEEKEQIFGVFVWQKYPIILNHDAFQNLCRSRIQILNLNIGNE